MKRELLEAFQTLNDKGGLVKQESGKDTCVAVVYLNLANYLGNNMARNAVISNINIAQVITNFEIGRRIVEHE